VLAQDLLFSPCGNIRRIKLYRDQNGHPKGDALVTYVKPGSVNNAIQKVETLPSLLHWGLSRLSTLNNTVP
jgi:RNA recognition motif-containing protein